MKKNFLMVRIIKKFILTLWHYKSSNDFSLELLVTYVWWRRWELNPRPKTLPQEFLRVHSVI